MLVTLILFWFLRTGVLLALWRLMLVTLIRNTYNLISWLSETSWAWQRNVDHVRTWRSKAIEGTCIISDMFLIWLFHRLHVRMAAKVNLVSYSSACMDGVILYEVVYDARHGMSENITCRTLSMLWTCHGPTQKYSGSPGAPNLVQTGLIYNCKI